MPACLFSAQLYKWGILGKIPILPTTFFHLHFMDQPSTMSTMLAAMMSTSCKRCCRAPTMDVRSLHIQFIQDPPIRSFHTKTLFKSNEKSGNGKRCLFYVRQSLYKNVEGMFQKVTWQISHKILMEKLPGHSISPRISPHHNLHICTSSSYSCLILLGF